MAMAGHPMVSISVSGLGLVKRNQVEHSNQLESTGKAPLSVSILPRASNMTGLARKPRYHLKKMTHSQGEGVQQSTNTRMGLTWGKKLCHCTLFQISSSPTPNACDFLQPTFVI